MKLIVVMSIEEYADHLRKLFITHKVPVYSEAPIQGFKLHQEQHEQDDWFVHRHLTIYSHLIFAFVDADKAQELMSAIDNYSRENKLQNPIRAFQLAVENAV
ncbi:hypothetical protein JNM05_06090 [bacterium]|nr:hypothetical protein [bacterium]